MTSLNLEIALMSAQLEEINREPTKLDLKWEPWKALAAALGGAVVAPAHSIR